MALKPSPYVQLLDLNDKTAYWQTYKGGGNYSGEFLSSGGVRYLATLLGGNWEATEVTTTQIYIAKERQLENSLYSSDSIPKGTVLPLLKYGDSKYAWTLVAYYAHNSFFGRSVWPIIYDLEKNQYTVYPDDTKRCRESLDTSLNSSLEGGSKAIYRILYTSPTNFVIGGYLSDSQYISGAVTEPASNVIHFTVGYPKQSNKMELFCIFNSRNNFFEWFNFSQYRKGQDYNINIVPKMRITNNIRGMIPFTLRDLSEEYYTFPKLYIATMGSKKPNQLFSIDGYYYNSQGVEIVSNSEDSFMTKMFYVDVTECFIEE